jgi:hypothetical protein
MRESSPTLAIQFSSQLSSVCSETRLWRKITARSGASPTARKIAAISRTLALKTFGSWGTVMACRSTMQK